MNQSFKMCYWEDKADLIIDKQIRRSRNAKIFKRNHNRNYYNDICSNVLQYKHKGKSIKNDCSSKYGSLGALSDTETVVLEGAVAIQLLTLPKL